MPPIGCETSPAQFVNRRCGERYPVNAELEFRILRTGNSPRAGMGVCVNLSSSGILFWTPELLEAGQLIELRVLWPGWGPHLPIVLQLFGRTVRVEGNHTAVEIWKQDYGIQRASAPP